MYSSFYGLTRKPFRMTPDPAFLYMTDQHREALAGLTYAILDRKGFIALSGTAGAGKTTLLSWVLQKLPVSQIQSSVILNPTLTRDEFLEAAMLDFGITDIPSSKAGRLWLLQKFLAQGKTDDKISVLVIDEAHKLSPELLEEIRLLGNFEASDQKLLQVVLIGQTELDDLLNRPDLGQFKQRISVRLKLKPLGAEEVGQYVQHRWAVATDGNPSPFTPDALTNLARWSNGIPRLINSICDSALICAFADTAKQVNADHVEAAAKDLCLIAPSEPLRAASKPIQPPATPVAKQVQPAQPPVLPAVSIPRPQPQSRPMFNWYDARLEQRSVFVRWASKLGLA